MRQRIVIAMSIAAGGAAIAFAQAQPQIQPMPKGHPGMMDRHGPVMHAPVTRADTEKRLTEHFAMLDINHDGAVTRDEIAASQRAARDKMHAFIEARMKEHRDRAFDRLDANKDGSISREEFAAATPPHPPGPDGAGAPPPEGNGMEVRRMAIRGPMMGGPDSAGMGHAMMMMHGPMMGERWFERADSNHDNKVTLAEAKTSALARFDKLDANHDGTIQPEERRMAFRTFGRDHHGPPLPPPSERDHS
jgi:hypothetical protein